MNCAAWSRLSSRRGRSLRRTWLVGVLAACLWPGVAAAQGLPLKQLTPSFAPCPTSILTGTAVVSPTVIDSLLAEGSRAAILGDHETARDLLREAARLDPTNPTVSYRLARTLDEQGEAEAATLEYCRYLTIAPSATDTAEVRERLQSLASAGEGAAEAWRVEAERGVTSYGAGRYEEAARAFTTVSVLRPDLGDAFYNRGLAWLALGRRAEAATDLEAYLRLSPNATDSAAVQSVLRDLGRAPPALANSGAQVVGRHDPGAVLLRGLLVPGLGQFTTGRRLWGAGVLAGAVGALYLASGQEQVTRTVQAEDPFGNPYEYEETVLERPNQAYGVLAAVAIVAGAAIESYFYADRNWTAASGSLVAGEGRPSRLSLELSGAGGIDLEVRISMP
jgi:tetratricopeptide (TPR) repeat protein